MFSLIAFTRLDSRRMLNQVKSEGGTFPPVKTGIRLSTREPDQEGTQENRRIMHGASCLSAALPFSRSKADQVITKTATNLRVKQRYK